MKVADFRRLALALEGAEEGSHMGNPDFRVGGRIFATLASQKQGYGNLMLTPRYKRSLLLSSLMCFCPFTVDGAAWVRPTFDWLSQRKTSSRAHCTLPGSCVWKSP